MPDWRQFFGSCLGRDVECSFCDATRQNGFNIVHSDADFTCFRDRSPAAKVHLLLIPKRHVPNVRYLSSDDVPMLVLMRDHGRRLLSVMGVPEHRQRLGFHIAPANSVAHLHLHLLSLPLFPLGALKYSRRQATRWFIEIDDAITVLRRGERVTFGSSRPKRGPGPRPRVNFRLSRNIAFDGRQESVELSG